MDFKLDTEYIELFKLLKLSNLASSGGEAKHFIADGLVTVNGVVETRKACKIRQNSVIIFEENEINVI